MKKRMVSTILFAGMLICLPILSACGDSDPIVTESPATEAVSAPSQETEGHTTEAIPPETPAQSESAPESSAATNDILVLDNGHAIRPDHTINDVSIGRSMSKFQYLYDTYLKDTGSSIYAAIIPDKGYYLQDTDLPLLDYDQLFRIIREGMPYASSVDLTDTLCLEAYYYTDLHWRQEFLWDAAARICEALQVTAPQPEDFTQTILETPFHGMYYVADPAIGSDTICLLENRLTNTCTVTHHDTGRNAKIYDRTKTDSDELYDVYLSGAAPLLTIKNPQAATDRELIIFRDSFGSSMAPLLLQDYAEVTLVDIRYVSSMMLDRWIDFHGQDVLFLYSTLLINNSAAMN